MLNIRHLRKRFADHAADEFGAGEFCRFVFADQLAIAQDRNPVRDGINLVEKMGDEDNAQAFGAQFANDLEQLVDFFLIEAGSGLVENEQFG